MRLARWIALPIAFLTLVASSAAAPRLSFDATLSPDRPGQETTVHFALRLKAGHGEPVPPPLTELRIRYPSSIGLAVSGLGISTCSQLTLELRGPKGCPKESLMGQGSAVTAFSIGDEVDYEHVVSKIVRSPEPDRIAMYFNVEGWIPLISQLVLPGLLAPTSSSGYEQIAIEVPLLEAFTGGGDVSVTQLGATLGPRSLIYYEHVHGRFVPYRPRGILLPRRCPRHGFRFTATISMLGAPGQTASTTIPCG